MAKPKNTKEHDKVFDYRTLRLIMGLIALALPFVVIYLSSSDLSSISSSYYTEAGDFFVGMLFIIGALCWAYKGHTTKENLASKVASVSAIFVAIFPTSCDKCNVDNRAIIHYGSALLLFSILSYFCLKPFQDRTKYEIKGKKKIPSKGKKRLRSKIYLICGRVMIGCIMAMIIAFFLDLINLPVINKIKPFITFFAETIALCAFGIAWIVAGKFIPFLVDKKDSLI